MQDILTTAATGVEIAIGYLIVVAVLFPRPIQKVAAISELNEIEVVPDATEVIEGEMVEEVESRLATLPGSPQRRLLVAAIDGDDYGRMSIAALRRRCAAAGIRWANASGRGRHMKRSAMIAALAELERSRHHSAAMGR